MQVSFIPVFSSDEFCYRSYQVREQEANDALERKRQVILAQRKAATVQATMRFQRNLPGFTVMGELFVSLKLDRVLFFIFKIRINSIKRLKRSLDDNYPIDPLQDE